MLSRQPRSPASTVPAAGRDDVARLVAGHAHRDLRVFHAERAAEAAADLGLGHFGHRRPGGGQQPARLVLDAEFAQACATVVIGHRAAGPAAGAAVLLHHVGKEAHQFERSRRQRVGPRAQVRVVVEQMRQVLLQHPRAGAGRRHHVVVAAERLDQPAREVARGGAVAGVVGRLAAAGLRPRHLHLAAGRFQQPNRGEADAGAVEVHQAGDEQGDAGLRLGHGHHAGMPHPSRRGAGPPGPGPPTARRGGGAGSSVRTYRKIQ